MKPADRSTALTAEYGELAIPTAFLAAALSATAAQQVREIYAAIPIILFEIDSDGRILTLNPAFEKITGWSVQLWIGRDFIDLIVPEDQNEAYAAFQRLFEHDEQTFMRVRVIAATGETLTLEAWTRRIFDDTVDDAAAEQPRVHIFGYAQDITQSVASAQRLQFQDNLLNSVSDAVVVTDPAFYVVDWNNAAEHIYGWRRDEVIGKSLVGVLGTQYVNTTQEAVLAEFLRSGQWRGEVIQRSKTGELRHILASVNAIFDAGGRRTGTVAINRDITAEVNARQALARVEGVYRQAIIGVGGVPYQRDYSTPGYSFIGDGIEALTGYRADELTGALFTSRLRKIEAYGEHAGLSHAERVALARREGDIVWREDYLFERKDGSLVWLADHAVPVLDDQGQVTGSLGILMDITARKQAEEEQQRLQERIAQVERLETVGQLAGGVAHDFNNMLAVILMRTEMALQQVDVLSPLHRHLTEIYKTAQRSADLTRQLLGFARRQPIAPRLLDLNSTIGGMLPMLKHLIGEEIELIWKPSSRAALVSMDPAQVDQILVNLCVNARDAIEGAGAIVIATETVSLNVRAAAQHDLPQAGDYVLITLSDNGCGMSAEVLAHIFEPFFTTKEVGRGTGLGLATVYGIVQQNQGAIDVVSRPGMGTTFHIFLPAAGEPISAAPVTANPTAVTPGAGETILLVEDEAAVLEMASEGLAHLGYRVLAAHTPEEALSIFERHADEIDLLLTDVVMAPMSGHELAQRLHRHKPTLPVLYMSGYPTEIIARRGVLHADARLLPKPFTVEALSAAVAQVLR